MWSDKHYDKHYHFEWTSQQQKLALMLVSTKAVSSHKSNSANTCWFNLHHPTWPLAQSPNTFPCCLLMMGRSTHLTRETGERSLAKKTPGCALGSPANQLHVLCQHEPTQLRQQAHLAQQQLVLRSSHGKVVQHAQDGDGTGGVSSCGQNVHQSRERTAARHQAFGLWGTALLHGMWVWRK